MLLEDDILIEIQDVEGSVMLITVTATAFRIEMIGDVVLMDRVLHVTGAHIQGSSPGVIGRDGLNAIARRILREADADGLIVEGGTRTTGRNQGRRPRPFRYPR